MQKTKRIICAVIVAVCFIFIYAILGSMQHETLTNAEGALWSIITFNVMIIAAAIGCHRR